MSEGMIPPDQDPDEESVLELHELLPPPNPQFVEAVHAAINRREVAAQITTLSWSGLMAVMTQLLKAIVGLYSADPPRSDPEE